MTNLPQSTSSRASGVLVRTIDRWIERQGGLNAIWSPMFMGFQEVYQLSEDGVVGSWEAAMES